MFCDPGPIWGGTEGIGSNFHVLRCWIRLGRYRARRVPFSCLVLPDSILTVPRELDPVFKSCAPGPSLGGTEGVEYNFHVLQSQTHFLRNRGSRVPYSCFSLPNSFSAEPRELGLVFMFCTPGPIFCSTEGVGSSFHVLRFQICFRRNIGSRVLYSCFALPDPF
jgi:hypothetical protein